MTVDEGTVVAVQALRGLCQQVLAAVGVRADRAQLVADVLVDAELRGIDTHGVAVLPAYVHMLREGGINPDPHVRIVEQRRATALVDGDRGLGHVVAAASMDLAMERAAECGVGIVVARNSNHFGPAAYYASMAVERGMIGHVVTTTPALMVAWGGRDPVIGNNPFAYAIPAGRHPPIVVDMALSVVAKGHVREALADGEQLPAGWAVDADGEPTTDPAAALQGAVLPMAGHKGYALAVVGELLAGALPGALGLFGVARSLAMGGGSWGIGHLLMAVDVTAFRSLQDFTDDVDRVAAALKAARPGGGGREIVLPGEREHALRQERRRTGIPLRPSVVEKLETLSDRYSIEWSRAPRDDAG